MWECDIIVAGDESNMRLESYSNILKKMEKRPRMFMTQH